MKGYPAVEEDLKCLDLPLLFLRGGLDLLVTERDLQILMHYQAAARHACQPECGHTVALEDPAWFLEQIENFFPAGPRAAQESQPSPTTAVKTAAGPGLSAGGSP
jgi:pimeloyl-ACP methyl ester carboxylesterase